MKVTLYQLSSIHLLVVLFPIFYRLQSLRSSLLQPRSIAYSNALTKKLTLVLLLVLTVAFLTLRTVLGGSKVVDPTYFILQLIILTHLLIQTFKETELGLRSPWFTFGLYYMTNIIYIEVCNFFYYFAGEKCEFYQCSNSVQQGSCYSCRPLPMIASQVAESSGGAFEVTHASGIMVLLGWAYVEILMVISCFGLWKEWRTTEIKKEKMFIENSVEDQLELGL